MSFLPFISKIPKKSLQFKRITKNGELLQFRWELLRGSALEEYLDFKINYYVKYEMSHTVSGMHKQPEAIAEYRNMLLSDILDPLTVKSVCCLKNTNNIIAINSLKLHRKGDTYNDIIKGRTEKMKRFSKIIYEWNKLCPIPDVMAKYNVETYFHDSGLAVHPDFRGFKITHEVSQLRENICKDHGVTLTGAWLTSVATQRAADKAGWEPVYEITFKDMEKKLNATFENPPPTFQFKVKRI